MSCGCARRTGARARMARAGVDGVTAAQYEINLDANLTSLLERFKSGRCRAPAVRRVHIPKPGKAGKTRPIGIPTLEDKVLQRAVLMVLEPICQQDFLDGSYGFRPGRSAHQALAALWQGLLQIGGGWVIDLDIQSFFDDVDWGHLPQRSKPAGARRCDIARDRPLAQRRRNGIRHGAAPGPGNSPRRCGVTRAQQTCTATTCSICGLRGSGDRRKHAAQ